MSNDLEQFRRQLKTVDPLLKSERLKLDILKKHLEEKNREYDEYKLVYDKTFLKKDDLLSKIEDITSSGNSLNVETLSNVRHYLSEVNEELIEVASSLKCKQQAADKAVFNLTECHVDVKLMEKYKSNKNSQYLEASEKIEARELEDLWLQNNIKSMTDKGKANE